MTDRRENTDVCRDCWTCEPRPNPFAEPEPKMPTIGPNIELGSN